MYCSHLVATCQILSFGGPEFWHSRTQIYNRGLKKTFLLHLRTNPNNESGGENRHPAGYELSNLLGVENDYASFAGLISLATVAYDNGIALPPKERQVDKAYAPFYLTRR